MTGKKYEKPLIRDFSETIASVRGAVCTPGAAPTAACNTGSIAQGNCAVGGNPVSKNCKAGSTVVTTKINFACLAGLSDHG